MYIALPYIAGDANECNFPYALLHKTCPAFLKKKKKKKYLFEWSAIEQFCVSLWLYLVCSPIWAAIDRLPQIHLE